jgi:hypothetical protein
MGKSIFTKPSPSLTNKSTHLIKVEFLFFGGKISEVKTNQFSIDWVQ